MKKFISENFIIKYKKSFGLNSVKLKRSWFEKNEYLDQLNSIIKCTNFLSDTVSLSERLYCIMNNIDRVGVCLYCSNQAKYVNFVVGYRKHCGSKTCIDKHKKYFKDESGLTSYEKSGIGIKKYKLITGEDGKSNAQRESIKMVKTKKSTIIDGKDMCQISIEKCNKTKTNTILPNGLNISKNASIKAAKTMANTFIDGKSLKQLRIDKTNNTKKLISDNGLDGYENAFLNGAGKNSSIKYYNENLYYQGTYEKSFLDFMNDNNLISNVTRGLRFSYYIDGAEKQYRSDYLYNNIIFEIKSSWTYGKNDNNRRFLNHLKFKSVLNSNYKLIVIFDKTKFIEVTKENISNNLYSLKLQSTENLLDYINKQNGN